MISIRNKVSFLYRKSMNHHKNKGEQFTTDPSWFYPELPPNHPDSARLSQLPALSKCPVENGVVKTP